MQCTVVCTKSANILSTISITIIHSIHSGLYRTLSDCLIYWNFPSFPTVNRKTNYFISVLNLVERPVTREHWAWGRHVRSEEGRWVWRFNFCATFQAKHVEMWDLVFPPSHSSDVQTKNLKMFPTESRLGMLGSACRCKNLFPGVFYCESVWGKNWQLNTNWDFLVRKNKCPNINCNPIVSSQA